MENASVLRPSVVGLLKDESGESELSWHLRASIRAKRLKKEIERIVNRRYSLEVVCEMPIFFATSSLGPAAAGTGSLQKLCFLVGCFAYAFVDATSFEPVEVQEWKGQLPKEVVKKRIQQMLGLEETKNYKADIWDAVGVGLYKKGVFK